MVELLRADTTVYTMELCEEDVPGASLQGRDPSELKIPELKRWLTCRGAPLKGKKADLVARYD